MKFSQMLYTRPELEATKAELTKLTEAFEQADSADKAVESYMAADKFLSKVHTMGTLAYIRHSIDTKDEFYEAEQEYFDEVAPLLEETVKRLELALINSPHRKALEQKFGNVMFKNIEIDLKTFNPSIIAELQQENKLCTEYDKLLASAQIEFDGKTLTLSQMTPYLENKDRNVRIAALDARSAWFKERADKLDELFDELVKLRVEIAKKLRFDNFVELGYYRMTRNCYDKDMVAKFREGVRKYIVPVAARLKQEQAERLDLPGLKMYDDALLFPEGNEDPFGTPEEIVEQGRKMYHELSPETAEFIDFMLENELFDVLSRTGKSGGGYCATIDEYKSPFIFANFNGTSGDIDVLTHEAGHALNSYLTRDKEPSGLRDCTYETAEVHSMSMEFFTWPWMDKFFKNADKYRYSHLAGALTFIPYGVMVDEFQHRVYENPGMTPRERNEVWKELEGIYRPWLDLSDTPFFEEGRRWQSQAHIFERPFYYIDYCLAQTIALSFWAQTQEDRAPAWEKYLKFMEFTGTETFTSSIDKCGLPDPFDPEALRGTADAAAKWLDNRK
ncbi:MAG: M3 family oligoendopeptidase [Oscillospiraceae bacterium]|nr:M3 family oligoendopeptidase [Oscillospiraceae bacterium]